MFGPTVRSVTVSYYIFVICASHSKRITQPDVAIILYIAWYFVKHIWQYGSYFKLKIDIIARPHGELWLSTVKAWETSECVLTACPLQRRHNEHDGLSNHRPHDCLLNHLSRSKSQKTSKLRVTGLFEGDSPVTGEFPTRRTCNTENVSIWWRHHALHSDFSIHLSHFSKALSSNTAYDGLERGVWFKFYIVTVLALHCEQYVLYTEHTVIQCASNQEVAFRSGSEPATNIFVWEGVCFLCTTHIKTDLMQPSLCSKDTCAASTVVS